MTNQFIFSGDPLQDLLNAVVTQAAEDYRAAYIRLSEKPGSRIAQKRLEETEGFFLSDDFSAYTDLRGKKLLKMLEKERNEIFAESLRYKDTLSLLECVWSRVRASCEREYFEKALQLRDELLDILGARPMFAKSLFPVTAQTREMIENLNDLEEVYNQNGDEGN